MEMKRIKRTSATTPCRVLVCEDDALFAHAIEEALNDCGVTQVMLCASATLAMAALEETRPDVIVLDSHLSDRDDGWAIAELAAFLGPKPPTIIFSTAAPDEIPPDVARLGTIVAKPYDPVTLVEAIMAGEAPDLLSRLRRSLAH